MSSLTSHIITPGTGVRFTTGPLGLIEHPDANRFEPETVTAGDIGEYLGLHPTLEGWHLIRVVVPREGRPVPIELVAPCHRSQFGVIA